ncbi:hypothetical protein BCR33DRAFT_721879 [Rhizoclosmatium globosum]|uniref:Uncharacterized protein n=1 Tax=Rhizoclosmatium globosum TaxID=329046 RepID=A0A1Y2BPX9_9FUNG|nr:hypothetical protein BCR33DRAFT_721879 [Rhizoclosmatium globosum]|eukprot:ORY36667.1 hypothetical protein BCR33DRAFT_721879 [Rhizoclosmatium globosum]
MGSTPIHSQQPQYLSPSEISSMMMYEKEPNRIYSCHQPDCVSKRRYSTVGGLKYHLKTVHGVVATNSEAHRIGLGRVGVVADKCEADLVSENDGLEVDVEENGIDGSVMF